MHILNLYAPFLPAAGADLIPCLSLSLPLSIRILPGLQRQILEHTNDGDGSDLCTIQGRRISSDCNSALRQYQWFSRRRSKRGTEVTQEYANEAQNVPSQVQIHDDIASLTELAQRVCESNDVPSLSFRSIDVH